ncbi:MAG: TonB C-terminal domain-containing protein [Desulfuromonadales bacterium]
MTSNRFDRRGTSIHPDPKIGRMLLCSLGLHLVVVLIFAGVLIPRFHREPRPVYTVDLVNLPVKNPQAGRPEAHRTPSTKKPQTRAPAPAPAPPPTPRKETVALPEKEVPKPPPVKKTVARKAPAKPAPKPKPKPKPAPVPKARYDDALSAIQKMRRNQERKQDIEELKKKLAAMAADDTRTASPIPEAPVGMPEGKGDEAGPSQEAWLHQFLKKCWSLSKYQVSRRDLEAKVNLVFDARGNLLVYRFLNKSGDPNFDDSVRFAILQLKGNPLPLKPGRRLEVPVTFNLKDLMDK